MLRTPRYLHVLIAIMPLCVTLNAARAADTPSMTQILSESSPAEWRALDPSQTLYMDLPQGHRVIIELAPGWAPEHVANIKTLVQQHYFDNTSIYRVQDNFVVQWGDPNGDDPKKAKPMGKAKTSVPPEYSRKIDPKASFTKLPDGDIYAPEAGFIDGLPVGRDPKSDREWLVQCYGMVGVSRDIDPDSGSGNTLYTPIGQAPRRLDHQLAVVGRIVEGMQWLSALPRGTGPLGMYSDPAKMGMPILSVRLASDLPPAKRVHMEALRTDSKTFARVIEANRNRHDAFYKEPAGHISICNVPLPVREVPPATRN